MLPGVVQQARWTRWAFVPVGVAAAWALARLATPAAAPPPPATPEPPRAPPLASASALGPVALPPPVFLPSDDAEPRIAATAPMILRFSRPLRAGELTVSVKPAVELRLERPPDGTLRVSGVPRWKMGRRYVLSVEGASVPPQAFRTSVPPPTRVTPGEGQRFVFSFDDAPRRLRQADRLLSLLSALKIKALLFPTGTWVKQRHDWVEQAKAQGHRVCNHSLSHLNLTLPRYTEEQVRREIVEGATDGDCRYFRPPLMAYDARVARLVEEAGLELMLWDVDSRDWEGAPAEDLVHLVLGQARPGAVALFHVHGEHTFEALPLLAERLRAAGYVLSWDPSDATSDAGADAAPLPRERWRRLLQVPLEEPPPDHEAAAREGARELL